MLDYHGYFVDVSLFECVQDWIFPYQAKPVVRSTPTSRRLFAVRQLLSPVRRLRPGFNAHHGCVP